MSPAFSIGVVVVAMFVGYAWGNIANTGFLEQCCLLMAGTGIAEFERARQQRKRTR